jgi:alanine racemase
VLDGCHGASAGMIKAANLRPVLNQPGQIEAWTAAGTISYEMLTSITPRVPRLYVG